MGCYGELEEAARLECSSKSCSEGPERRPQEESWEDTVTEINTVSWILGLYPLQTKWDTCQRQAFQRERRTEKKK